MLVALVVAILACLGVGSSDESTPSPLAYGQFCYAQKLSGHGLANMSISVQDDINSVDYSSSLIGDGDFEMDQVHEYSQDSNKLKRRVYPINDTKDSNITLFEHLKLTYSGSTPLVGENHIASTVGGDVEENFIVNKIERYHEALVASTIDKSAKSVNASNNSLDVMSVGIKNSFEGSWSTDATWSEMLSKNITAHEALKGKFEVEKSFKFLEKSYPGAPSISIPE
jgi:hypothetical protein